MVYRLSEESSEEATSYTTMADALQYSQRRPALDAEASKYCFDAKPKVKQDTYHSLCQLKAAHSQGQSQNQPNSIEQEWEVSKASLPPKSEQNWVDVKERAAFSIRRSFWERWSRY